jgi:hypothetical protein
VASIGSQDDIGSDAAGGVGEDADLISGRGSEEEEHHKLS